MRKNLRTHVGDIDVAAVPCGFGRAIGNKVYIFLCLQIDKESQSLSFIPFS